MKQYERDTSGALEQTFERVLKRFDEFDSLRSLHFLFTWKHGDPETDHEKQWLTARTKKLSVRERDVYGFDVEICVHHDTWLELTKAQRYQTIFHELLHVNVFLDEEVEPAKDDDGRVKFTLAAHDVRILAFERELEVFGLPSQYKGPLRKLRHAMSNGAEREVEER